MLRGEESKLGAREVSLGFLRPQGDSRDQTRDAQGARGVSWVQGEQAGCFLRPQGGSRALGMLWG